MMPAVSSSVGHDRPPAASPQPPPLPCDHCALPIPPADLVVDDNITIPNLHMGYGVIRGQNTLTISKNFEWDQGTLQVKVLNLAQGAEMKVDNQGSQTYQDFLVWRIHCSLKM